MTKILITSALPYANGPLHFGHIAGAYLPADAYARAMRLMKHDVLFICGSDEYGIAITLNADLAGRTPKEHVDIYHEVIKNFFKTLNLSFDHYSRTTSPFHKEPVQQYFKDLLENGYIEEKETEQLYSEKDQKFLADRYVEGTCPSCGYDKARGDECPKCGASYEATDLKNPRSKLTQAPLIRKKTTHWFLLLDKFKDKLTDWLNTKDWKPNVTNFVKGYIDELRPRAITRDMTWGIPVPVQNAQDKVLYVWFDAPIGYISSTMEWAAQGPKKDAWKDYWCDKNTKLVHFIGKDNIPFHAVIFPAMTMGQNLPLKLVDELPANEFYNLEGRQFSKSDGWMIDLESFFTKYSADQIRYTIAANAPETADAEFTWKDFQLKCNTDLLGKFGNFIHRVLVFAKNNCEGKAPALDNLQPVDTEFLERIRHLTQEAKQAFSEFKLRRASQLLMELASAGNVYFDTKKPWKDAKVPEGRPVMETTIACCLEAIKNLALLAYPIIPDTAFKVWRLLGFEKPIEELGWAEIVLLQINPGQLLGEPEILFRKIEDEEIVKETEHLKEVLKKLEQTPKEDKKMENVPVKPLISYDEFSKVDLRVAKVLQAERVPKSKKLLKLQVKLGEETRQIVAGIGLKYTPEDVVGRNVIVVANLKPAELMGEESKGMVLCAGDSLGLHLISVEADAGSEVK